MNSTAIAPHAARPNPSRPRAGRWFGLAVAALGIVGASACGSGTATLTGAAPGLTTTTVTTVTTSLPASSVPITPPSTSGTSPATRVTLAPRPTAAIDELVGTVGERVHVRCVGAGDTTVVLIAGFGGDSTGWANVEPAIATHTRVCSYDRPGTGSSDPAGATATFTTQATELHTLLRTIGEPAPYVLVGHSFGGAEAVTFASLFPTDVAGLVLVDASPTTWPAALCAVSDDGSDGAATLRALCSSAFAPTGNSEHLDVNGAFAALSDITSLGALPIAVITATDRELPADLAAGERARLTDAWDRGQQGWMALSPSTHLVSVDDTSHNIHIDQPAVVIEQIARLLP